MLVKYGGVGKLFAGISEKLLSLIYVRSETFSPRSACGVRRVCWAMAPSAYLTCDHSDFMFLYEVSCYVFETYFLSTFKQCAVFLFDINYIFYKLDVDHNQDYTYIVLLPLRGYFLQFVNH
jgi:hypothetical protein